MQQEVSFPSPNAFWVIPNRFIGSDYPGCGQLAVVHARLESYIALGVRAFLDLTNEGELKDQDKMMQCLSRLLQPGTEGSSRRYVFSQMGLQRFHFPPP